MCFLQLLEDIVSYILHGDREKFNKDLANLLQKDTVSSVEKTLVQKIKGEQLHIEVVRKLMKEITGQDSLHGWSKDYFHMSVYILAFKMGFKSKLNNILVKVMEQHYECEGYNPEHMDYCGHLLSDEQILEMAIDRLSRYIELNHDKECTGSFDLEPKFRSCPVMGCMLLFGESKCQHELDLVRKFRYYVSKYKDSVFNEWEHVYF